MYRSFVKPFFDRTMAVFLLVLLSPLFLVIIISLYIFQSGQIFFTQPRAGLNEKMFVIFKFKSMRDSKDARGDLLPEIQRVSKIGGFLRATSLDELPQLLNVIKGQMSFVGPRPLPTQYLPLYSDVQRKRHQVLPGITGWTQVNGRNDIPWTRKLELDVFYAERISFFLDFAILVKTVVLVLSFKKDNSLSEKAFTGNR